MLSVTASVRARRVRGFSLIELMVTITLLSVLLGLAVPFFGTMIRNNRIRSVAEALQNGLRTAQTEAVRRNRQVVFSLTNQEPGLGSTAAVNGVNWAIHTVPPGNGEPQEFVQGGSLGDIAPGVSITAADAAICFNSVGRLTINNDPGVGGALCAVNAAQPPRFDLNLNGADRPLRVLVALGGQVRMCDSSRALSATTPEGCP